MYLLVTADYTFEKYIYGESAKQFDEFSTYPRMAWLLISDVFTDNAYSDTYNLSDMHCGLSRRLLKCTQIAYFGIQGMNLVCAFLTFTLK